jgi:predicted DNA-binding transcriptional regulator YafY
MPVSRNITTRRSTRGSQWQVLRRCLVILQRLGQGPASAQQLMAAVVDALGGEAYPPEAAARRAAFKHDREHLRTQLGAIWSYDPLSKLYTLEDAGPYACLSLCSEDVQALALLARTFSGEIGEHAAIQDLLQRLAARLPVQDRRRLESVPALLQLDFQQGIDSSPPAERVWQTVQRATGEHRKLAFNYLSPQYDDCRPRYHEVAPYRVRFRSGHWYLRAFSLRRMEPDGQEQRPNSYRNFRMSYIQDDERLAVLPDVLPGTPRRSPRIWVHYRLLPPLGRGAISRHFDEMQITPLPDGSADVQGYTEDDWWAARLLLGYGENCLVLGGTEVLERVQQTVRGMARLYGLE